jgi:hypothetical protein
MKKMLSLVLGLGLLSQQTSALAVTESITGETFAGYANSVISSSGTFLTDTGSAGATNWSYNLGDITNRITDTSAGSSILGVSNGASITLGLSASIFNGAGDDLKLFFVGNNGHHVDVTVGGVTKSYTLGSGVNTTGYFDTAYPSDPIVALPIDLAAFNGLSGTSFNQISLMVGNGYDCQLVTNCTTSSVVSFAGAVNVVPVPAAVWLFGSGLVGLAGIARKRA